MGTVVDQHDPDTRTEKARVLQADLVRKRGTAALNLYFAFDGSRRQGLSVEPTGRVLTDLYRICGADTLDECEDEVIVVEHTHQMIKSIRSLDGQIEHTF